ncbi:tRNA (guanine-N(7)-)-methyltransferase [Rhizocola hellebori]|uniref:tRNA (guanine-N(7)-)-methyltransferase n=1 Tax=Rhizocola hellebori TaxID=1392758 RepID=A0A8J3QB89_9ACTN|nr:tRNA (guanosine(46)-N7)-methyltransferase TrmB [Rhizocola hellebori]GIH06396.1 tRNA (guanine-N(7)-)-methyltransferase [Rhizocola hellebori]
MTEHHTKITTFYPRRGRVSGRHEDALARLLPRYGVTIPGPPLDLPALFGRAAPVVLEIGSGMGDATVAMAQASPERDFLAVEVFPPGLGNLLAVVEEAGLSNVRVASGDALELVRHMLAPESVDAIHVFFPDPWPKLRHHKRRLIQRVNVTLLASRLKPGGTLHCATDWAHYAEQMLEVLGADPALQGGIVDRPRARPVTKFEQRALAAGRSVIDLIFVKRA